MSKIQKWANFPFYKTLVPFCLPIESTMQLKFGDFGRKKFGKKDILYNWSKIAKYCILVLAY